MPKLIPARGLIGAPLLIASATVALFRSNAPVTVLAAIATVPIFVWELSLGIWLVVKGLQAVSHHSWHGSYRLRGIATEIPRACWRRWRRCCGSTRPSGAYLFA